MDHLVTETQNLATLHLDELSSLELVRVMNAEDGRVLTAVAEQAPAIAAAIDLIAERLRQGGRLIYVGAGTSGRLGVLDATECPPTFNSPPSQVVGLIAGGMSALTRAVEGAEDQPELAEQDLTTLGLEARDVVVGIATSGRTPYVGGALRHARQVGASAIGLFCNPDAELAPLADLVLAPVVGPEVLTGSTRLKAGTVTKLILNMLSTGAMVRLGKTFGNWMVDLRATNSKLRARSNRIVRQLTGLDVTQADALLASCGGELKTALVAQRAQISPEEARARLQAVGGQVRRALRTQEKSGDASPLVVGIDGGGSHTVALLADTAGTVLGRGTAGPSNLRAIGAPAAVQALDLAIQRAFAAAGLARSTVDSACLGLAGAGRAEEQALIRQWAQQIQLAPRLEVTTDVALLLAAGTPQGWGLALVAGTGSIAHVRSADGHTARAGGWGPLFGDEGSGYALALAALRAAAHAADGRGPQTALLPRLLQRLNLEQPHELIAHLYAPTWDRTALASLASLLFEVAAEGDALAGALIQHGACELAQAGCSAVRQLKLDHQPVPLALAGGLLLGQPGYRQTLLEQLHAFGIQPEPVTLVPEPAQGALLLAGCRRTW